jgi:acyl dehydratase
MSATERRHVTAGTTRPGEPPQAPPVSIPIAELGTHVGRHLGYSPWHEITQEAVERFADATGDHQWIHVDEERAKSGPFGRTIAHGYLTLSLAPALLWEILDVEGVSVTVNYGLDKVRFPAPVPVGARVRLGVELASVDPVGDGVQVGLTALFELEGQQKPCCAAEILFRYYP